MGLLGRLRVFGSKWEETARENFSKEDIKAVRKAVVVESDYGHSVCFHLNSGGVSYMPVSRDTSSKIGQVVDLEDAEVLTLSREGDEDIYRIEF